MIHLDYRDARPIYSQIIGILREQIRAGVLKTGEKLPSVRELAAELSINPNTIQRAYRALEADGWIVTIPGKGCFVSANASCQEQEKQRLLTIFDEAAAGLLALGTDPEELMDRIRKGGKSNA